VNVQRPWHILGMHPHSSKCWMHSHHMRSTADKQVRNKSEWWELGDWERGSVVTCLFCTVNLTVTRRPFQSLAVSLAISSPIFLGESPSGPILGASDEAAPTSPPVHNQINGAKTWISLTLDYLPWYKKP
jgi:hypothetical protein